MELLPNPPSALGPRDLFTGTVYLDTIYAGDGMSRLRASFARFAPGSRTAWHSHAHGQLLHITVGAGLVQARGGQVLEVHAGDTVYSPPGEWHWHGATPDRFMTHLALWAGTTTDDVVTETTWGELLTEVEYTRLPNLSTRVPSRPPR